jgi:hypothetical protein
MKKIFSLVFLFISVVFLSACSSNNYKNISNDDALSGSQITEIANVNEAELQNDMPESQNKVVNNNFVYKNDDYRFQITLPSAWNEAVVKSERGLMYLDNNIEFHSTDLVFGLPVKVNYQEKQDVAEKCPSCFLAIFRLHVLSRDDSRKFEIAREANIQEGGASPANGQYIIIASNNEHVFYGPSNFHGQSYDGEFMASRETEARDAVYNQFMTWNYFKFPNK